MTGPRVSRALGRASRAVVAGTVRSSARISAMGVSSCPASEGARLPSLRRDPQESGNKPSLSREGGGLTFERSRNAHLKELLDVTPLADDFARGSAIIARGLQGRGTQQCLIRVLRHVESHSGFNGCPGSGPEVEVEGN